MRKLFRRLAPILLAVVAVLGLIGSLPAVAAPTSLKVSKTAVSFPSTNYGTYSFSIVKQAGTTTPLFCIDPETDSISTSATYTNKGTLTQSMIDGITWSHDNGTTSGYGKPTANQIYSILWHAVNTEGLDLNNLTNGQQGAIQMAIKHWRQSTAWGVKATAGTEAANTFDLAKRLQASARNDLKTMQTTKASISVSAPTERMTRSGSTYTIATWTVSGTFDSYTVTKDSSTTSGVTLSKSGNTITAKIPAAQLTGPVTVRFTVKATKAVSKIDYFTASGSQTVGFLNTDNSTAKATGSFSTENDEGVIEVFKTGNDGTKLKGAVYTITNTQTGQAFEMTTNTSGYAYVDGLPYGQYNVEETGFPSGYEAGDNQTSWEVEITSSKVIITINAVNDVSVGHIGVYKTDDAGSPLSGVGFGFYAESACQNMIGAALTNEYGMAFLYDQPAGTTIYVRELHAAGDNYVRNTTVYAVTVAANTTTYANGGNAVINDRKGRIALTKADDAGTLLGAGYTFGIYGNAACTIKVTEMVTDSDSVATSDWLVAGDYWVKELSLPLSDITHHMNTTPYKVTVTKGGVAQVNGGKVVNPQKRGCIAAIKFDRNGRELENTVFLLEVSVLGSEWRPVTEAECRTVGLVDGTLTTTEWGDVTFEGLVVDPDIYYRLTEIYAPEGYALQADHLFEDTLVSYDANAYNAIITVLDDLVPVLPMTGGAGAWVALIGTATALLCAVCLFHSKKVPQAQADHKK